MTETPHAEAPPAAVVRHLLNKAVEVNGVPIRYRVSGKGDRDLILVHGHLAHHLWWHAVVPALEPHWRVIQLDLSGHGDSGHRGRYDIEQWADEVIAVLEAAGSVGAVVAGHSLGGSVAIAAAARRTGTVAGLIVIDTYVVGPGIERPHIRQGPAPVYSTRLEGLSRFRLVPLQPGPSAESLAMIAESSLRQVDGGWTWKFDRASPLNIDDDLIGEHIAKLNVPTCYIYGEQSGVVGPEVLECVRAAFPTGTQMVGIADAHHHVVLDSADQCAQLINAR